MERFKSEEGPDEGKVYNLLRGLQKKVLDDPAGAVVLHSHHGTGLPEMQDLEDRKINGTAAMVELESLALAKAEAKKQAKRDHGKQFKAMMTALVPNWRDLEQQSQHATESAGQGRPEMEA